MKSVTDWAAYAPYITPKEARCRCGCGIARVSKRFADKLLKARISAGIPFIYTSFCRCEEHNACEGGEKNSAHLTSETEECEGCDILYRNNHELFIIVSALIAAGFTRIGINRALMFVHVDDDSDKPQQVLFSY
jgi:hypothetical protein